MKTDKTGHFPSSLRGALHGVEAVQPDTEDECEMDLLWPPDTSRHGVPYHITQWTVSYFVLTSDQMRVYISGC